MPVDPKLVPSMLEGIADRIVSPTDVEDKHVLRLAAKMLREAVDPGCPDEGQLREAFDAGCASEGTGTPEGFEAWQLERGAVAASPDERTHYVFPDAEDAGNENATACGSLPLAEPSREVARVDCLQCLRLLAVAGVAGPADEGLRPLLMQARSALIMAYNEMDDRASDEAAQGALDTVAALTAALDAAAGCLPEDEGLWITSDEGEACLEALRALPDGGCCEECDRCEARKTVRAKLEPPRVGDKDPT